MLNAMNLRAFLQKTLNKTRIKIMIIKMKILKLSLLPILFFFLISDAFSQEKLFTYDDYMNWDLYPESIQNLSWRGNSGLFTFVEDNALIQQNPENPVVADTLIKFVDLKSKNSELDELRRFPGISWLDNSRFYFTSKHKIFVYNFDDDELIKVNEYPEEADNVELDQTSFSVAYTIENNLFVSIDGNQMEVSKDDNPDMLYGYVPSRNEFGISKGSFWSPKGKLLAFYQIDQTDVADYPMVDIYHRIAEADPISYPMAGEKSQKVQLGIFDPGLNQITYIRTPGAQNQYLTSVTWGPDGKYIYMGVLNRDQNHLEMNKYDAVSGKFIKTLFEESNERYVEPQHDLYFLSQNSAQFIWQSRRDGWNHLYLYNTEGELISQITKGEWEVTDLIGIDEQGKNIFYESTQASPIERQLYKTDLKKGKTEKLTSSEGTHSIKASPDKKYFIDVFSSVDMARAYYILGADGEIITT